MKGGYDRQLAHKKTGSGVHLESKTATATHNARRRLQGHFTTKLSVLQALYTNKAKGRFYMGDYIKEAFERMNLHQFRNFILYGADDFPEEAQSYCDKLKQGSDPIYKRLESTYTDKAELDKAVSDLSEALNAHENVYMELGMKAGARLLHQLLLTDDKV